MAGQRAKKAGLEGGLCVERDGFQLKSVDAFADGLCGEPILGEFRYNLGKIDGAHAGSRI